VRGRVRRGRVNRRDFRVKHYMACMISGLFILLQAGIAYGDGFAFSTWPKEAQIRVLANAKGRLYLLEVEQGVGRRGTVVVRAGGFSYDSKRKDYTEEGSGTSIGFGGKYYFTGGMKGIYAGCGLDYFRASIDWENPTDSGSATLSQLMPDIFAGYKILFYNKMSFEPSAMIGVISRDDEAEAVYGWGAAIGLRF